MNNLYLRCVLAGILFGAWPLFMNRSKLTAGIAVAVLSLGSFLCALPLASRELNSLAGANWLIAIVSAIAGGLGSLIFNSVLTKTTPQKVGSLFIFMILAQIITPAIYDIVINNNLPIKKALGFIAALAAAILLV